MDIDNNELYNYSNGDYDYENQPSNDDDEPTSPPIRRRYEYSDYPIFNIQYKIFNKLIIAV